MKVVSIVLLVVLLAACVVEYEYTKKRAAAYAVTSVIESMAADGWKLEEKVNLGKPSENSSLRATRGDAEIYDLLFKRRK